MTLFMLGNEELCEAERSIINSLFNWKFPGSHCNGADAETLERWSVKRADPKAWFDLFFN